MIFFEIFVFFRHIFKKFTPLHSWDQHETSYLNTRCYNSMILRSILKSIQPIGILACSKFEKTAKNNYFSVKLDFLSPSSAQTRNFQNFTFSRQYVNVLLYFRELHHFSEKWTLTEPYTTINTCKNWNTNKFQLDFSPSCPVYPII